MLIHFTHQYLIFVACRNRNQLYDGHCEKKCHWDDARISDDSGIKPDLAARIDTQNDHNDTEYLCETIMSKQ